MGAQFFEVDLPPVSERKVQLVDAVLPDTQKVVNPKTLPSEPVWTRSSCSTFPRACSRIVVRVVQVALGDPSSPAAQYPRPAFLPTDLADEGALALNHSSL